jgi:hypothetical protein
LVEALYYKLEDPGLVEALYYKLENPGLDI